MAALVSGVSGRTNAMDEPPNRGYALKNRHERTHTVSPSRPRALARMRIRLELS